MTAQAPRAHAILDSLHERACRDDYHRSRRRGNRPIDTRNEGLSGWDGGEYAHRNVDRELARYKVSVARSGLVRAS